MMQKQKETYEQYLEQWIAVYCGKLSKRGRDIAAIFLAALEEATAYVMRLKREEGGR